MSKPPKAPPHSDLDGVNQDEVRNVDAARAARQGSVDLKRARDESKGRPDYSTEDGNRDDRSR